LRQRDSQESLSELDLDQHVVHALLSGGKADGTYDFTDLEGRGTSSSAAA
jgi:hypothetical protein